jgi:hypothetical protein
MFRGKYELLFYIRIADAAGGKGGGISASAHRGAANRTKVPYNSLSTRVLK